MARMRQEFIAVATPQLERGLDIGEPFRRESEAESGCRNHGGRDAWIMHERGPPCRCIRVVFLGLAAGPFVGMRGRDEQLLELRESVVLDLVNRAEGPPAARRPVRYAVAVRPRFLFSAEGLRRDFYRDRDCLSDNPVRFACLLLVLKRDVEHAYRSITHSHLRKLCYRVSATIHKIWRFQMEGLDGSRTSQQNMYNLYNLRSKADYDPSVEFAIEDARVAVSDAEQAVKWFEESSVEQRRAFLMLLKPDRP